MEESRSAAIRQSRFGDLAVVFYIATTYILPLGVPVVTAIIGYGSGLSWFWIWLGALAAFAFISTGLLRFAELLERRRTKDKLTFSEIRVGRNIRGSGMFIGVTLNSQADIPMEVRVKEVKTQLGDKVPVVKDFALTRFGVPARSIFFFNDHIINIDETPKPGTIEGFAEFHFEYGRHGKLSHALNSKETNHIILQRGWCVRAGVLARCRMIELVL